MNYAGRLSAEEQKNRTLEYENVGLSRQLEQSTRECEDLRKLVEQLRIQIRELEQEIKSIELECTDILQKWSVERQRIEEDNQRLKVVCNDRLIENERLASYQGAILIKLALSYAEVDRLSSI